MPAARWDSGKAMAPLTATAPMAILICTSGLVLHEFGRQRHRRFASMSSFVARNSGILQDRATSL